MRGPWAWPPWASAAAAVLLIVSMAAYAATWMAAARWRPASMLGLAHESERESFPVIAALTPGGPSERAGLRVGDAIEAVDGRRVEGGLGLSTLVHRRPPGSDVRLTVRRAGRAIDVVVTTTAPSYDPEPLGRRVLNEALRSYPLPFLLLAAAVLLLHPTDPHVWRLALVFAGLVAGAPVLGWEAHIPPELRGFAIGWKTGFFGLSAAAFLSFFAQFPERSPLDRRWPWARRLLTAVSAAVAIPLAVACLVSGGSRPLAEVANGPLRPFLLSVMVPVLTGGYLLGLASLVANARRGSAETRRKSRVMLWGTLAAITPILVLDVLGAVVGRELEEWPYHVWAPVVVAMFLFPLSFAYAVVRHRVLDVPVLLRRSARYLLVQRGFVGLLVLLGLGATQVFASSLSARLPRSPGALPWAVVVGAAFGIVLVAGGAAVHRRARGHIDRAFFRAAYDSRHVLQDLAARARLARSREELARLVEENVRAALRPEWTGAWLAARDGRLRAPGPDAPAVDASEPALADLARRGRPLDLGGARNEHALPPALASPLPECLVPVVARDGALLAVFALGPRLSEEPYSREDLRLLATVADHAAIALDGIRLGEEIAERLEAQRRTDEELDLARRAQARLLVHDAPVLRSLEFSGRCVQARAVGGDYFDFLDLGPGRVGLVLADVSGKGFAAALLMASLQASLRSTANAIVDFPARLEPVHTLLLRSSESNRYATLFVAAYDEASGQLVYANCGHNPPMLLRADGTLERLGPTAPVVGLLDDWACATATTRLAAGDLLAVFSDGITEALSDGGEEFGEARLALALERHCADPLPGLIDAVVEEVRQFSGREQEDDITLVVARGTIEGGGAPWPTRPA